MYRSSGCGHKLHDLGKSYYGFSIGIYQSLLAGHSERGTERACGGPAKPGFTWIQRRDTFEYGFSSKWARSLTYKRDLVLYASEHRRRCRIVSFILISLQNNSVKSILSPISRLRFPALEILLRARREKPLDTYVHSKRRSIHPSQQQSGRRRYRKGHIWL